MVSLKPQTSRRLFIENHQAAGGKHSPDLVERVDTGKPLTKSTQTLRMDDDSLQALSFSKENIEEVARVRRTVAEAMGQEIKQDVSIPVVDRHRALAEEVADHIEKQWLRSLTGRLRYLL